jgi:hypothetical protein
MWSEKEKKRQSGWDLHRAQLHLLGKTASWLVPRDQQWEALIETTELLDLDRGNR